MSHVRILVGSAAPNHGCVAWIDGEDPACYVTANDWQGAVTAIIRSPRFACVFNDWPDIVIEIVARESANLGSTATTTPVSEDVGMAMATLG